MTGRTAHPRVGGENDGAVGHADCGEGSSPRGRGKLRFASSMGRASRLIPAWAGKTLSTSPTSWPGWAHPRVGGENGSRSPHTGASRGSSPRGRGKRRFIWVFLTSRGLIPAWAGKTPITVAGCRRSRAHPRVGGENPREALTRSSQGGSSPRGRGKQAGDVCPSERGRLIPAWAGKTFYVFVCLVAHRAHPRVGGENSSSSVSTRMPKGSSPRGRGKHCSPARTGTGSGLIPAWAGKTIRFARATHAARAHPRVGGENRSTIRQPLAGMGSSPRGRGKRKLGPNECLSERLIPAWAGKTVG